MPLAGVRANPEHLASSNHWLRCYQPEHLFDDEGPACCRSWPIWRPRGDRRMGANPHANGGAAALISICPTSATLRCRSKSMATARLENTRPFGKMLRDVFARNAEAANFRIFCPDELASNRLDDVFEVRTALRRDRSSIWTTTSRSTAA